MGDPKRLLSELSDADGLERDLLGSLRHVDPPSDAKGVAWARLSTQLAGIALVSTAGGSAAAAAKVAPGAFKLLGAKAIAGLAIAGAAVGATAVWVHYSSSPASKSSAPNAPVATAQVVVNAQQAAAEPSEPPAPEAALPTVSAPSALAPRSGAPLSPKDRLAAESALLTQARAQLRGGDASAAQQTLNKLRTSFPKGMLGQEREVLSIEVLSARGNAAAARKRAQAFIAAYPKSPHSAQLSRFADAP